MPSKRKTSTDTPKTNTLIKRTRKRRRKHATLCLKIHHMKTEERGPKHSYYVDRAFICSIIVSSDTSVRTTRAESSPEHNNDTEDGEIIEKKKQI